jgi:hypothetical protein
MSNMYTSQLVVQQSMSNRVIVQYFNINFHSLVLEFDRKCRPLEHRMQEKQVRENRNKLCHLTNNLIILKKESHKSLGQENLVNAIYKKNLLFTQSKSRATSLESLYRTLRFRTFQCFLKSYFFDLSLGATNK